MMTNDEALETQITQWRNWLRRRQAIGNSDVEELEGHLRDLVVDLRATGLAADEAFLVAVKRRIKQEYPIFQMMNLVR